MGNDKTRMTILAVVLTNVIIMILYPLILDLGYIRNKNFKVPTGNVDIFDITVDCEDGECNTDADKPVVNEEDKKPGTGDDDDKPGTGDDDEKPGTGDADDKPGTGDDDDKPGTGDDDDKPGTGDDDEKPGTGDDEKPEIGEDKPNINDLIVSDNYDTWGNKTVRIFSNPAYEFTSKIAPGSSNSYTFVIQNNSRYNIKVDFEIVEDNPHKVNMKYKLRSRGKYLAGDDENYTDISKLQLKGIKIKAHESIPYILDWKWIDSDNDTEIGEKISAEYKLTINIGANTTY